MTHRSVTEEIEKARSTCSSTAFTGTKCEDQMPVYFKRRKLRLRLTERWWKDQKKTTLGEEASLEVRKLRVRNQQLCILLQSHEILLNPQLFFKNDWVMQKERLMSCQPRCLQEKTYIYTLPCLNQGKMLSVFDLHLPPSLVGTPWDWLTSQGLLWWF